MSAPHLLLVHGLTLALLLPACQKDAGPPPAPRPRPVTVLELAEIDPVEPLLLAGSVESWKQQNVAFQVSGQVAFVVEETTNVEGRWVKEGQPLVEGDVLGLLDDASYVIARDSAKSAVRVAEETLRLGQVELDKVLPARRDAAKASRDGAVAEYDRIEAAAQRKALPELDRIRAQANRDEAEADLIRAEADIEAKRAELEAQRASVAQANDALRQAELDLARCTLYSPFSGEVSEVLVEAGGYVNVGEPLALVIMMEPMRVDLAVAPDLAAALRRGQTVTFYPPGSDAPSRATVYEIATTADADTRTFRVSLLARNKRFVADPDGKAAGAGLPLVDRFVFTESLDPDDPDAPLMVEELAGLRHDEQGDYVWAAPDVDRDTLETGSAVLSLRKVRVVPGEQRLNLQGLYVFRSLNDPGDLRRGSLVALDVPEDYTAGQKVLVGRRQWLLRPGQVVRVLLEPRPPPAGLYVPLDALRPVAEGRADVFVLEDEVARKVAVRLEDRVGELIRIEASDDAGRALLVPGARLIVDFLHFLVDGESVRVIGTRELRP